MTGLLDTLAGSSDPSTADPTTGLVDSQRKQLAYGILGQTGAALLAAGSPMMPGQQGQYLAQLGNIPNNVASQQSQMVQQNAMAQQVKLRQAKVEQDKSAQAYVSSPEFQQSLSQMPDVLKAQAIVNIKAGNYDAATKVVSDFTRMQIQAHHEQQLEALKPPTVTHDANGDPIAFDPRTRTWNPIAAPTDQNVRYGLSPPSGGGQASGSSTAINASTGQPTLPDGTEVTDGAPSGSPAPASYPNASINPNLPYSKAFGLGGAMDYAHGRIQGNAWRQSFTGDKPSECRRGQLRQDARRASERGAVRKPRIVPYQVGLQRHQRNAAGRRVGFP